MHPRSHEPDRGWPIRPPRLRLAMRLRTLLALVGLAGMTLGLGLPRWHYCQRVADHHDRMAILWLAEAEASAKRASPLAKGTVHRQMLDRRAGGLRTKAAEEAALARRYRWWA